MKFVFLKNVYVYKTIFEIDGAFLDLSQLYLNNLQSKIPNAIMTMLTCKISLKNSFINNSKMFLIDLGNSLNLEISNSIFSGFIIKNSLIICDSSEYIPILVKNTIFQNIFVENNLANGSVIILKIIIIKLISIGADDKQLFKCSNFELFFCE